MSDINSNESVRSTFIYWHNFFVCLMENDRESMTYSEPVKHLR